MMTANPFRKAISQIARNQKDSAKDGIYREVGRTIIMLSNIEQLMAMAFMIVSNKMTGAEAAKHFYSLNSFDQRFKLVEYAIAHNDWGGELEHWKKFSGRISKNKKLRNDIAHWRLFVQETTDGNFVEMALMPQHMSDKKGRLNLNDLKRTADDLEELHHELWMFIKTLTPGKEE
jgi:hypothetical protein